jgi:hypothetical protein
MKEVIERAVENDYKLPQTTIGHVGTWSTNGFREWYKGLSIYELIFGTNLVECLVGEGKRGQCIEVGCDGYYKANSFRCGDYQYPANECKYFKGYRGADYHLQEMLKIRMDIEKLKEYLRGLSK